MIRGGRRCWQCTIKFQVHLVTRFFHYDDFLLVGRLLRRLGKIMHVYSSNVSLYVWFIYAVVFPTAHSYNMQNKCKKKKPIYMNSRMNLYFSSRILFARISVKGKICIFHVHTLEETGLGDLIGKVF